MNKLRSQLEQFVITEKMSGQLMYWASWVLLQHKTWYHIDCYTRFSNGKSKPKEMKISYTKSTKRKLEEITVGKPVDIQRAECFLWSMKILQNELKCVTIKDIFQEMASHGCEPYSQVYMKSKLNDHFGEDIEFYGSNRKMTSFLYPVPNIP